MLYNVYSVRDSKVGYGNPFVDLSDSSAVRGFNFAFSNPTSMVNFSPSDFSLYRIGSFDSDKGIIERVTPEFICCAVDFVGKEFSNAT